MAEKATSIIKESGNKGITCRNSHRSYSIMILSVLKNNSDETHPITIEKIRELLKQKYFPGDYEKPPDKKTVRKQLNDLTMILCDDDPTNKGYGASVVKCIKKDKGFIECDPFSDSEESGKGTGYYYYKSAFDKSEITMLIDSLEAHNYFSAEDISGLVSKIADLSPFALKRFKSRNYKKADKSDDPRINKNDSYLLENLKILRQILDNNEFAKIDNCFFNSKHRLEPIYKNPVIIKPLKLMFNNGYYYLIAAQYSKKNEKCFTVHYRIDRLGYIESYQPTKDEAVLYDVKIPGDAAGYRLHHPIMFGGDLVNIEMKVTNSTYMYNVLYDVFGSATDIKIIDDKSLKVRIKASRGGTRLFATEYCADVKIISPADLREDVISDLKKSLGSYDEA